MADFPEKDRFVLYASVATGNSFINGMKGFVQALVVVMGRVQPFSVPTSCSVFVIEFLAAAFGCLILTYIGSSMVAGVVVGIDVVIEKVRFSTSCTIIYRGWFPAVLFVCCSLCSGRC